MSKRLHAAKSDSNQPAIVEALRAAGYAVDLTHRLGGGFPDIIAWSKTIPAIAVPMEVKQLKRGLNEVEQEWWDCHQTCLKTIVQCEQDALDFMALVDRTVVVG